MTPDQLAHHLLDAQLWLLGRGYARGARHYGPPVACNQAVQDAALVYFETVWGNGCLAVPPGYTYMVVSCSNMYDWDTKVKSALDRLVGNPQLVERLSFHDIVPENPSGSQTDMERLSTVLDYLKAQEINVLTLSDVLDGARGLGSPLCGVQGSQGR